MKVKVAQSCLTLCNSMDCTFHWILQARILEWVAFPFSRGISQSRDETQVSHIASRFLTSWATRKAQEYWNGQPIPSPGDLPDPRIQLGSPALQADYLPTELWGKLLLMGRYSKLIGIPQACKLTFHFLWFPRKSFMKNCVNFMNLFKKWII